jgi:signal transduction histidine kinase
MIAFAVVLGAAFVFVYGATESIVGRFVQQADADLLVAIESGPLQLARLDSADLATKHLVRLMEQAREHNRALVSAKLSSGPNFSEVYADWRSPDETTPKCPRVVRRDVSFPDGIYPFLIELEDDPCRVSDEVRNLRLICVVIALLGFGAALATSVFGVWPILRSLRIAEAAITEPSDDLARTMVTQIPVATVASLADKALETKRLQALASVARAAQMIAHDLRKPFSTMRAGLFVLRAAKSPEKVLDVAARLATAVDASAAKVSGMLDDMLTIGQPVKLDLAVCDLGELLDDCVRAALAERGGEIEVVCHYGSLRHVRCDARRLSRVLQNLVDNAVQAMRGVGRLIVALSEREETRLQVRISNSVGALDAADVPKLFDPFFSKGKAGGTGLGLAVVKQVTAAHDGQVWCEPNHPDGVSFFVVLPVSGPSVSTREDRHDLQKPLVARDSRPALGDRLELASDGNT